MASTRKKRRITEADLSKDEVRLLGMLLQGIERQNLRAGIRLVTRGWCEWAEPEGKHLLLTPLGLEQARKLWPGLDEDPPLEPTPVIVSEGHVAAHPQQLALVVPALVTDPDGLTKALAEVIGDGGEAFAEVVLEHYPDGRGLPTASEGALVALGISRSAAKQIREAFRLARCCRRKNERWGKWVRSPEDMAHAVYEACGVADLEVEHFWVGAVDAGESLIEVCQVAQGSLSTVSVSMRDVFVPLCRARAASLFLAHNHPSGDLAFSNDDLRLTQRIISSASRLEIAFLDHVVLAPDGRYASLREEECLK